MVRKQTFNYQNDQRGQRTMEELDRENEEYIFEDDESKPSETDDFEPSPTGDDDDDDELLEDEEFDDDVHHDLLSSAEWLQCHPLTFDRLPSDRSVNAENAPRSALCRSPSVLFLRSPRAGRRISAQPGRNRPRERRRK